MLRGRRVLDGSDVGRGLTDPGWWRSCLTSEAVCLVRGDVAIGRGGINVEVVTLRSHGTGGLWAGLLGGVSCAAEMHGSEVAAILPPPVYLEVLAGIRKPGREYHPFSCKRYAEITVGCGKSRWKSPEGGPDRLTHGPNPGSAPGRWAPSGGEIPVPSAQIFLPSPPLVGLKLLPPCTGKCRQDSLTGDRQACCAVKSDFGPLQRSELQLQNHGTGTSSARQLTALGRSPVVLFCAVSKGHCYAATFSFPPVPCRPPQVQRGRRGREHDLAGSGSRDATSACNPPPPPLNEFFFHSPKISSVTRSPTRSWQALVPPWPFSSQFGAPCISGRGGATPLDPVASEGCKVRRDHVCVLWSSGGGTAGEGEIRWREVFGGLARGLCPVGSARGPGWCPMLGAFARSLGLRTPMSSDLGQLFRALDVPAQTFSPWPEKGN